MTKFQIFRRQLLAGVAVSVGLGAGLATPASAQYAYTINGTESGALLSYPSVPRGVLVTSTGNGTYDTVIIGTNTDAGHALVVEASGGEFKINGGGSRSSLTTLGNGARAVNVTGGKVNLTNVDITTKGQSGAHGVIALEGANVTLANAAIETQSGAGSTADGFGHNVGLYVLGGSQAKMTGGSIKTNGVFVGYGVEVIDGDSYAELNDVNITTNGNGGSAGVRLNNLQLNSGTPGATPLPSGSGSAKITGGSITTTGAGSPGVFLQEYSKIDIDGTQVRTTGFASHGLFGATDTEIRIVNADIKATGASAYGIWVNGTANVSHTRIETGTYAASGGNNNGSAIYISSPSATVRLDDVTIITNGKNAQGIWLNNTASGTGKLTVRNSMITVRHQDASGISTYYGNTEIFGTTINVRGLSSAIITAGVYAHNQSVVVMTDSTIVSTGLGASGVTVENGSRAEITGGSISTSGGSTASRFANAFNVSSGSELAVSNAAVSTTGVNSNIFAMTAAANTTTNKVTASGGSFTADQGAGIFVQGGTNIVSLTDTTLQSGENRFLDVASSKTSPTPTEVAALSVTVNNSVVNGTALLDAYSTSNVTLNNGSVWNVQTDINGVTNSVVTSLVNNGSRIVFAAPTGDPALAASYMTLTTGGYSGNGGTIALNTYLAGDGSPSDRLVIDAGLPGATGTATGLTHLLIVDSGGLGAQTVGDGILVIETLNGATTATGAFDTAGRVAAGAYDYTLYRGGSASDENWYLRSTLTPPTPNPPTPEPQNIRPEVPVNASIIPMAAEYGFAVLGTLHERVGETWIAPPTPAYEERTVQCKDRAQNYRCVTRTPIASRSVDAPKWFGGAWARVFGDKGSNHSGKQFNFAARGPSYDYILGGLQAGLDVYGREAADGSLDKAGVYVAYGQVSGDVKGVYGGKAGSVDMDAYTLGAYWTHHAASGWYTDAIAQSTWYSTEAKSYKGELVKPDGWSGMLSLEGGYAFRLSEGLTLEPQAQLIYQRLSFDDVADSYGWFRFSDTDSLRGRLGARLAKTWNAGDDRKQRLITGWLRANVWHEFLGDAKTTVTARNGGNPYLTEASLGGTWGEIGAGISGQVTNEVTLFSAAAYNRSLDGKGREEWNGRIGLTAKW